MKITGESSVFVLGLNDYLIRWQKAWVNMVLIFQTRARPPDIRDGCSNPRSGRDNFPTFHLESKPDIIWPGDWAAGPRPQAEDPLCEHDHRQQERTPNILLFHGRGLLRSLKLPDSLNVWVPPGDVCALLQSDAVLRVGAETPGQRPIHPFQRPCCADLVCGLGRGRRYCWFKKISWYFLY